MRHKNEECSLMETSPDFTPETWSAFRRQALEGQRPKEVAHELGLSLLKRLRQELEWLIDE